GRRGGDGIDGPSGSGSWCTDKLPVHFECMYGCTAKAYQAQAQGGQYDAPGNLRPMGRAVFIDCFSGASGDMLLGALFDAGVSVDDVRAGLLSLPVGGWTLDAEAIHSHGLPGTRAKVKLTQPDQPHRGLGEVVRIIRQG